MSATTKTAGEVEILDLLAVDDAKQEWLGMNMKSLWTTHYGNNAPTVSLRGREYAITVREEVDSPRGRETRYRATRPDGKTEVFLRPEDVGAGQPYSWVTPKRKLPPEIRGDMAATA